MTQNQFDKKSEAWSALFSEPMSDLVKRYTSSVFFDKRLWQADIQGSLAHAGMLAAQGIIGVQDHAAIERGMAQIRAEIESGAFEWKLDLEDVHLNIEARLTQLVGTAAIDAMNGRVVMVAPDVGLREFTFDGVLSERSSQRTVYDSSSRRLVMDFLNGFNATVMVYGQTG
eukprot:gene5843-7915_t